MRATCRLWRLFLYNAFGRTTDAFPFQTVPVEHHLFVSLVSVLVCVFFCESTLPKASVCAVFASTGCFYVHVPFFFFFFSDGLQNGSEEVQDGGVVVCDSRAGGQLDLPWRVYA